MNTVVALWIVAVIMAFSEGEPPARIPELLNAGRQTFAQTCAGCHGRTGDGKGPMAASIKPSPTNFRRPLSEWPNTKGTPEKIFRVIKKGTPHSRMVARPEVSKQQRWALTYVLMDFSFSAEKNLKPMAAKKNSTSQVSPD